MSVVLIGRREVVDCIMHDVGRIDGVLESGGDRARRRVLCKNVDYRRRIMQTTWYRQSFHAMVSPAQGNKSGSKALCRCNTPLQTQIHNDERCS